MTPKIDQNPNSFNNRDASKNENGRNVKIVHIGSLEPAKFELDEPQELHDPPSIFNQNPNHLRMFLSGEGSIAGSSSGESQYVFNYHKPEYFGMPGGHAVPSTLRGMRDELS